MKLRELLDGYVSSQNIESSRLGDSAITGLALNSSKVDIGNIFIALAGLQQHGLVYLTQALARGAIAIIFDPAGGGIEMAEKVVEVPVFAVNDLSVHLGALAARYYENPSQSIDVIGITGTNGKTSCSQFLGQMLQDCGVIGTLGWGRYGNLQQTVNTTPDALEVHRILAEMRKDKMQSVAMEVSSHGLALGRVNAVNFQGAVFTNVSRDHLDFHGTMQSYLEAKLELLSKPGLRFVVVNLDDSYSAQIINAVPENVVIWGVSVQGKTLAGVEAVTASASSHTTKGLSFDMHWSGQIKRLDVPVYGDFNVENILISVAVMLALGVELSEVVEKVQKLKPVIGRMEHLGGNDQPLIFVDYAHTPDALNKVLCSLRKHCAQNLWVVFGCGGNRDKGKRPEMGQIAQDLADHVIVTDDNPRFEESSAIINDITSGCRSLTNGGHRTFEVIQNRELAIQAAIRDATQNDCVLIAGKGHEGYQEIKGVRMPYSDREVVINALRVRADSL